MQADDGVRVFWLNCCNTLLNFTVISWELDEKMYHTGFALYTGTEVVTNSQAEDDWRDVNW